MAVITRSCIIIIKLVIGIMSEQKMALATVFLMFIMRNCLLEMQTHKKCYYKLLIAKWPVFFLLLIIIFRFFFFLFRFFCLFLIIIFRFFFFLFRFVFFLLLIIFRFVFFLLIIILLFHYFSMTIFRFRVILQLDQWKIKFILD